jgi:hypothetical protein
MKVEGLKGALAMAVMGCLLGRRFGRETVATTSRASLAEHHRKITFA